MHLVVWENAPDVVGNAALAGGRATDSDESEQRGPEAAHRKGRWPDTLAATSKEKEKDVQAIEATTSTGKRERRHGGTRHREGEQTLAIESDHQRREKKRTLQLCAARLSRLPSGCLRSPSYGDINKLAIVDSSSGIEQKKTHVPRVDHVTKKGQMTRG